jgi:hypothetical protein
LKAWTEGFAGRRAEARALLREIVVAMAGDVTVRGQLTMGEVLETKCLVVLVMMLQVLARES